MLFVADDDQLWLLLNYTVVGCYQFWSVLVQYIFAGNFLLFHIIVAAEDRLYTLYICWLMLVMLAAVVIGCAVYTTFLEQVQYIQMCCQFVVNFFLW